MMRLLGLILALVLCSSVDAKRVLGVSKQRPATPVPVTGLAWGCNGDGSTMFKFTDANLQPFYPATYIRKVRHRQQNGYYTQFFWGWRDGGDFTGYGYYGAHPYPKVPDNGNTHWWEVSQGTDQFVDDNANDNTVLYDTWVTQVNRVYAVGDTLKVEYYWDWEAGTDRIITGKKESYLTPASPAALTVGDAPWNPNSEMLCGDIRGFQFYQDDLSLSDIGTEIATPLSTGAGAASIWYLNINPTPTDITDKSGQGHNPAWVGSNRPTLYAP